MSATTDQRERELKFDVPSGWEIAEPAELVPPGGSIERELVHLESVYFDTDQLDLLRSGLTLRRRTGDTDSGWQLKVPEGDARTEIRHPLDGRDVPDPLRELTLGASGGSDLRPVATLRTDRLILRLTGADHGGLAEIAVDSVTAIREGAADSAQQWREVEVELLGGDENLLARAANWLNTLGARPAASGSKLAHALNVGAPPDQPDGLGGLIASYLDAQRDAILRGDIDLRRHRDAVHKTRVGTRRYRSVLRVFADVLDTRRASALDTELKWYAQALGELRDRQVLRAHLDEQLAALPDELVLGPVAARIHQAIDTELARARVDLDELLVGERYQALMREVTAWHEELPLLQDRPAADVRRYLRAAKRKVRKRLRAAAELPPGTERDTAMHSARKAAKRARYTAELSEPLLGSKAEKTVAKMKDVQNALGARQDGVVAAEFLRRLGLVAGTTEGENGFTFGLLFEQERTRMRDSDRTAAKAG
jgi:CHAD domain-containing protein